MWYDCTQRWRIALGCQMRRPRAGLGLYEGAPCSSSWLFWISITHLPRAVARRGGHIGGGVLADRTNTQITMQAISLIKKQFGNTYHYNRIEGGLVRLADICTCRIGLASIFIATPGPQGPRFGCRPFYSLSSKPLLTYAFRWIR